MGFSENQAILLSAPVSGPHPYLGVNIAKVAQAVLLRRDSGALVFLDWRQ